MKKSKDKSKDKSKSFKKLKVLAASTLGLSMLLSVPQMPNLANLVGQIGANKNQEVVDFSVKDAIKNNSAVTGAKTTTVDGANLGNIAQETGVSAGRQGGGLADESKLPTKATVSGSWEDSFWTTDPKTGAYRRMTMAELLALEPAQGNIFKKLLFLLQLRQRIRCINLPLPVDVQEAYLHCRVLVKGILSI